MAAPIVTVVFAIFLCTISLVNGLSYHYYDHSCPQLESIVTGAVRKAMMNDKTVPAALLRMHFHDCFIRVNIYILTYSLLVAYPYKIFALSYLLAIFSPHLNRVIMGTLLLTGASF